MIEIQFYETEDGYCPIEEYLNTLPPKLLAKTFRTIDLLEHNGIALREPFSKALGEGIYEMNRYAEYKRRMLENPTVRAEYDALKPEYDLIQAMIDARISKNLTQKELSARTGITQADISRIENGTRNPSLSMVQRLAAGLGMRLKLEPISTVDDSPEEIPVTHTIV